MKFIYILISLILIVGAGCITGDKTEGDGTQAPELARPPAPATTVPAVTARDDNLTVVEKLQLINDKVEIIDGELQFDEKLEDKNPSWSPDGNSIVYESFRSGNLDIMIMNRDGGSIKQLTFDDATERDPSFSPDSKQIVFERHDGKSHGIWIMDTDAKNMKEVVSCDKNCMSPSWSPDGSKIIYALSGDLWTVDVDTGATSQITGGENVNDLYPSWSPDGKKVAYTSTEAGGAEIFVMDADGSNRKQLTDRLGMDVSPSWSPDGKWIVFESQGDIWAMYSDGSNQHALVRSYGETLGSPSWSPDGSSIAVNSNKAGSQDIWVLKIKVNKN